MELTCAAAVCEDVDRARVSATATASAKARVVWRTVGVGAGDSFRRMDERMMFPLRTTVQVGAGGEGRLVTNDYFYFRLKEKSRLIARPCAGMDEDGRMR